MIKKWFRVLFAVGFIIAGIYHFVNPEFYYPMFPSYFPWIEGLNYAAGALEILLGLGLLTATWRDLSVAGIAGLLILYLPIHIYMVQEGGCVSEDACLPLWAAWVRLVVIQPLLIFLALWLKD